MSMKRKCPSAKDAESSSDGVLFLDGKLCPHKALTQPDAASSTEGHVSHMLSDRLSSRCMGWSPIGAEPIARMRTYIANGGNLEAYARKQFTAHRQTMKPEVNQEILKKEWICIGIMLFYE